MEKRVKLKDGREVLIREMRADDIDRSLAFFQALPEEDKIYLRRPINDRDDVRQRMQAMESGRAMRLVAVFDEQIVADGTLELEARRWKKHIGEIRLIVAHPFQNKGLGKLIIFELYKLANKAKVDEIIAKTMGPQVEVQKMLEHLGFHRETALHDYVTDTTGARQDLVLMRCKLAELWHKMEDRLGGSDWQRTR